MTFFFHEQTNDIEKYKQSFYTAINYRLVLVWCLQLCIVNVDNRFQISPFLLSLCRLLSKCFRLKPLRKHFTIKNDFELRSLKMF